MEPPTFCILPNPPNGGFKAAVVTHVQGLPPHLIHSEHPPASPNFSHNPVMETVFKLLVPLRTSSVPPFGAELDPPLDIFVADVHLQTDFAD
jgi:hypothetical protein